MDTTKAYTEQGLFRATNVPMISRHVFESDDSNNLACDVIHSEAKPQPILLYESGDCFGKDPRNDTDYAL